MHTVPWFFNFGLKGLVVALLAICVCLFLRRHMAAWRHAIFTATLSGLVLLPLLAAMPPWLQAPVLPMAVNNSGGEPSLLKEALNPFNHTEGLVVKKSTAPSEPIPTPILNMDDSKGHESVANLSAEVEVPASIAPPIPSSEIKPAPTDTSPESTPTTSIPKTSNSSPTIEPDSTVATHKTVPAKNTWLGIILATTCLWCIGMAVTLVPPLCGLFGLRRLLRESTLADDPAWRELLLSVKKEIGVTRAVRLRFAGNLKSPLTWGVWHPTILIPSDANNWSLEERRLVLLHELAHIRRFDWATQMLAWLTCAVHWFNPLVWWIAKQMQFDREHACDDLVLATGAKPTEYATKLLELAKQIQPYHALVAIPMAQQSALEQRVRRILDRKRSTRTPRRFALGLTVIAGLALIFPIAMLGATSRLVTPEIREDVAHTSAEDESAESSILVNKMNEKGADIIAAEEPIQAPMNGHRVPVPECIEKVATAAGLKTKSVPAFHDDRNILQLSHYGDRRGFELNNKVSVLIGNGNKRFWLVDRFPHPEKTTVVGPFEGNAIETFELFKLARTQVDKSNASDVIIAISSLLQSDDKTLIRFGLELTPTALDCDLREGGEFKHFMHRALPRREQHFISIGLKSETEIAMASLNALQDRIDAATIARKSPGYRSGHAPGKSPEFKVVMLPDAKWGKAVKGLQAGFRMATTIRRGEVVIAHMAIRNVSDKPIRVTFPENPTVRIQPIGVPLVYSLNDRSDTPESWELAPGQEVTLPTPPIQFLAEGDFGLNAALDGIQPGPLELKSRISAIRDAWVTGADGKSHKFTPPADEWKGTIEAPPMLLTLEEEIVPYTVAGSEYLPAGHGLKYQTEQPKTIDGNSLRIQLRSYPHVSLYVNQSSNDHWLHDNAGHNRSVYWGPFPAERFAEFGFLERIEKQPIGQRGISALIRSAQPLAQLGLKMAEEIVLPDPGDLPPSIMLARTIREHRASLEAKGLKKELETALVHLGKDDAPLPPADKFKTIRSKKLPKEVTEADWGPENNGMRAAAMVGASVYGNNEIEARVFLQNVSDKDVYLTVADRAGYDYAIATDKEGKEIKSDRSFVYPMGFSGAIRPEYNPGQTQQSPPITTLTYLRLKPKAVWELKTVCSVRLREPGYVYTDSVGFGEPARTRNMPTSIIAKPGIANVTWVLHTANGEDFTWTPRKRIWPAKGGWSGILRTGPQKIFFKGMDGLRDEPITTFMPIINRDGKSGFVGDTMITPKGRFPQGELDAVSHPHDMIGAHKAPRGESNLIVLVGAKLSATEESEFHKVIADFSKAKIDPKLEISLVEVMRLTYQAINQTANMQNFNKPLVIEWKTPDRFEGDMTTIPTRIEANPRKTPGSKAGSQLPPGKFEWSYTSTGMGQCPNESPK